MTLLEKLQKLTGSSDTDLLTIYLENASDIICDLRNSNVVETKYLGVQLRMALEFFNKQGAEGQTGHSENGIGRTYEASDVSPSLIGQVVPIVKTPYSTVRVVNV